MDPRHERNFLKTLSRGLRVLTAFTPVRPELSLTEIAEILDVDPSTANRFTYTLEELGYLERDPDTKLYHVTPQIYALTISLAGPRDLRQVSLPHMERLRDRSGETVVLSVRDGVEIVIIEVVETHHTLAPRGWVGGRGPLYCSAMGKAMLAYLPEAELARVVDAITFTAFTPNTIINRLDFLTDLEQIRERGWSLNREEFTIGITSIGAPIFSGPQEKVGAAICIDVPTARLRDEPHLERLAKEVLAAAQSISTSGNYDLQGDSHLRLAQSL
jgi:DNA-binding IclR family transcriptional regulator